MPLRGDELGMSKGLLIVGPIYPQTRRVFEANVGLFDETIISTWEPGNKFEELAIEQLLKLGASINVTDPNLVNPTLPGNLGKQVATTVSGLALLSASKVARIRTDEFLSLRNFALLLDDLRNSQFLTGNFIVRPFWYHAYHISDHLFGGSRSQLELGFKALQTNFTEVQRSLRQEDSLVPESLIGAALLGASDGERFDSKRVSKSRFRKSLVLYDIFQSSEFSLNANTAGVLEVKHLDRLTGLRSPDGKALDFRYIRKVNEIFPRVFFLSKVKHWAFRWLRQIMTRDAQASK